MKIKLLFIPIIFFYMIISAIGSQFEELDKPPEGAHEGQMFVGGFISIGKSGGDVITGEENFVKNNTYKFEENEITKELLVTHLSYDFGASFEYMPIDYIGVKSKLKRVIIIQRTIFGADFQNWSKTLYNNFSFLLGPSFHLTNRKQWDTTFTPVLGYTIAKYEATPIAAELLTAYNGDRIREVNGIMYGAELNLTIYFSGGLFISIGTEWNKYPLTFNPGLSLNNSEGSTFMSKNSGNLTTMNLALSAGYAFSN